MDLLDNIWDIVKSYIPNEVKEFVETKKFAKRADEYFSVLSEFGLYEHVKKELIRLDKTTLLFQQAALHDIREVMLLDEMNFPRSPKIFANAVGDFKAIQWLYQHDFPLDDTIVASAVKHRNKEVVAWMLDKKFPLSELALSAAVDNDDVEMFEFLLSRGLKYNHFSKAVEGNRINMVNWFYQHARYLFGMLSTAPEHKEMIEFFIEKGYDMNGKSYSFEIKSLSFAKWLRSKGIVPDINTKDINIFRWLYNDTLKDNVHICTDIYKKLVKDNDIKSLEWLYSNKIYHPFNLFDDADLSLTVETLNWVFSTGRIFYENVLYEVASPDVIRRLLEVRPWDDMAIIYFLRKKDFKTAESFASSVSGSVMREIMQYEECDISILQWLFNRGIKCQYLRYDVTRNNGTDLSIWTWCIKRHILPTHRCMKQLAMNGNFHIMKWLVENYIVLDREIPINVAVDGQFGILKWMVDKRCWTMNNVRFIKSLIKNGHSNALIFLRGKPEWDFVFSALKNVPDWLKKYI